MKIHPTAIISDQAEIHESVEIGPYVIIKGKVKMGPGNKVQAHAIIGSDFGSVTIGEGNNFHSSCAVGGEPQDLKYDNDETSLIIGDHNSFREFCTVNTGTVSGGGKTVIGNHCLFMSYVHVAHDCIFGDHIVVANSSNFAGHVTVEDHVKVSGVCQFNQFITLGRYSYIAGDSTVNKDILPFSMAQGKYAVVRATNKIGLERAGFSKEEIGSVHKAIRMLTKGTRTIEEALGEIEQDTEGGKQLQHLIQFVKSSERGIAK